MLDSERRGRFHTKLAKAAKPKRHKHQMPRNFSLKNRKRDRGGNAHAEARSSRRPAGCQTKQATGMKQI